MNNSVSYEEKLLENDPFYTEGFNDGLEYSAKWIEEAGDDKHITVGEFAELNAMSLRAAKREVKQQDFIDGIKSDPDMYLKLEDDRDELLTALQLVLDSCDWTNGACRLNEQIGAILPQTVLERCKSAVNKNRIRYSRS